VTPVGEAAYLRAVQTRDIRATARGEQPVKPEGPTCCADAVLE
jgi:hypothetical protein